MIVHIVLIVIGLASGFVLLADVRPPSPGPTDRAGTVSVVIPARDEEASLPNLLRSLADQTFAALEVIVVDDGSTDATARLAAASGATVVPAPPVPDGWVGKTWACHVGARRASGDTLVFLDADVVLAPDGLARILSCWGQHAPDGLLSVQPFHRAPRPYEQLSAYPNLMAMMASGAFAPGWRFAAVAFGPCLVTSRAAYRHAGGHQEVAAEIIEDVHLARAYGRAGLPVHAVAGGPAVSFRMYPGGLRQLVDGWTKNLAGGPALVGVVPLLGAVAWLLASIMVATDLVVAAVVAATTGDLRWEALVAWVLASAQMALLLRRIGAFRWWAAPCFPLLLVGFVAIFVRSCLHRLVHRTVVWRDRTIAVRPR